MTLTGNNIVGTTLYQGASSTPTSAADIFAATTAVLGVNGLDSGFVTGAEDQTTGGFLVLKSGGDADGTGDATALPADVRDVDGDMDTAEPLPLDQIGNQRVQGTGLDLGAVELDTIAPSDITLSNSALAENVAAATVVGALAVVDGTPVDVHTLSLVDDAGGLFALAGSDLVTTAPFDFEAATSHQIVVRATDANGNTFDKTFTIAVTDINEAPTAVALSQSTVNETAAIGASIGAFSTTDPDAGDSHSYSLLNDAGGLFALSGSDLVLTGVLDFEAAASHQVTVRSTDSGGLTRDETLTINVGDVNEAPTALSLATSAVDENVAAGTVVGNMRSIDPDVGDTHSYTLLDDAGGLFAVSGNDLVVAGVLDFEDQPSRTVTVRSTDSGGLSVDQVLSITINDVAETFVGTPAPDTIPGDAGGNLIEGLASGDLLAGGGGDDTIIGDTGNDTIVGGGDNDRVHAGNDDDNVTGGNGNDTLHGDNEQDTLAGGDGNDTVTGGRGDDVVSGDSGDDELWGWLGLDFMNGGAGNDRLLGEEDSDTLDGWSGNDTVYGGQGWDLIIGGDGDDSLIGDSQNDTLRGGDGNDTLEGGTDDDLLLGEVGNDELWGWLGNDILEGGVGNDTLFGEAGDDVVSGGEDSDLVVGGDGNDTLWGYTGDDTLDGGGGNDFLAAEAGNDQFVFFDGFGDDTIYGFEALNAAEDINLAGVSTVSDFADLAANHMAQIGGDVLIDTGVGTIRLNAVSLGDLGADDFVF